MQIKLKDGYVDSYAIVGNLVGGIEVEVTDLDKFEAAYEAFKMEDGKLVFDEERYQALKNKVSPPTQLDRIEAQITYTAMVTDTLLEV